MSENPTSNIVRIRIIADGSQTCFYFNFSVFNSSDIVVYFNNTLQTDNYSVNLEDNNEGGSITFDTAPTLDTVITILRKLELKRNTNFKEAGPFMSSKVNYEFDYQLACLQQLEESIGRTVTFPPYSPIQLNANLPFPSAGKDIIWNESENSLENSQFKLQDLEQHISDTLSASTQNQAILTQNQEILTANETIQTDLSTIRPYVDNAVATKVNQNFDNLSQLGKSSLCDLLLPDSTRTITISLGTLFICPLDGYVFMDNGGDTTALTLNVSDENGLANNGDLIVGSIDVKGYRISSNLLKKGWNVHCTSYNGSPRCRFYPTKGAI